MHVKTVWGSTAALLLLILLGSCTSNSVAPPGSGNATAQLNDSLRAIEQHDDVYKAVLAIGPAVSQDAAALDANPGLLNGMPILVKDNIDILGLPTTAGSLALLENYPLIDAPLIAQIKAAGGLVLGKTNLSEWANFRSEKSSSGWSAVGGQTRNAYDIERSPCGSSSGSGVAVALGYVDVAIGTETHGSIICPSSVNGIVGFKPTHGIVSGEGIVPLALSQDTAGPMANSVENAALVLSAMIDPAAQNAETIIAGLRSLNQAPRLDTLRIGIQRSTLGYDPRRDALFELALDRLKRAGVTIVDEIKLQPYDDFWDENYQLLKYEFRRDLNAYLQSRTAPINRMTLQTLIDFNRANAEQELRHFDQGIFDDTLSMALSEDEYLAIRARGHKATRDDGLDRVFAEHKLDAVIGITTGPAWKIDHINGDSFFGPGMAGYPAAGGYPHITVPGGKIKGMPMGISFIGQRYQDHKLAQIVHRFELLHRSDSTNSK